MYNYCFCALLHRVRRAYLYIHIYIDNNNIIIICIARNSAYTPVGTIYYTADGLCSLKRIPKHNRGNCVFVHSEFLITSSPAVTRRRTATPLRHADRNLLGPRSILPHDI